MEPHSYQDMQTGISNRRFFIDSLESRRQRCEEFGDNCAILFFEIEDLKAINEQFGRAAGDAVLSRVARILRDHIRNTDVAARVGGDEFGLLFPHLNGDQVEEKIDYLFAELASERVVYASQNIPLAASIAYCCMGPQDTVDGLMSRVDFITYRSKNTPA